MNLYTGVVDDGLGVPVGGVSITAGGLKVVTDASGRYEFRTMQTSLIVTALVPPSGYEGRFSGNGTLTPGVRNFSTRRIVAVGLSQLGSIPLSDGTRWFGVGPYAVFNTGASELLTASREENVELTSSNLAVVKPRRDQGRPVVEGLVPGNAMITGTYWGVSSLPGLVTVVR